MVQTLNLILLTTVELNDLRNLLMMVNGIEPEKAQTLKYFKSNVFNCSVE